MILFARDKRTCSIVYMPRRSGGTFSTCPLSLSPVEPFTIDSHRFLGTSTYSRPSSVTFRTVMGTLFVKSVTMTDFLHDHRFAFHMKLDAIITCAYSVFPGQITSK